MWADVMCSGSVPKALERCTRSAEPPVERCTIWRRVASVRSAGGRVFCGSGTCCDEPQVAIQTGGAGVV